MALIQDGRQNLAINGVDVSAAAVTLACVLLLRGYVAHYIARGTSAFFDRFSSVGHVRSLRSQKPSNDTEKTEIQVPSRMERNLSCLILTMGLYAAVTILAPEG